MTKRFHVLTAWSYEMAALRDIEIDIVSPITFDSWYRALSVRRDTYSFYWTYANTGVRQLKYHGYFSIEGQGVHARICVNLCLDREVEDKVYDRYIFERKFFGRLVKRPNFGIRVTIAVK